jgi:hypothetical protein
VGTPDGLYDIVYSPGVCEHDEEGPEAILREAIRVTKRGGIVIVSAPCLNQLRRLAARLGGFSKRASGGIFYQYAFSQTELASILESLGCEHLETRTYGTLRSIYDLLPISGRVHEATLRKHTTDALRTNPSRLGQLVDALPVARDWGHSGVWIARKC